jgi:hypothetical protein
VSERDPLTRLLAPVEDAGWRRWLERLLSDGGAHAGPEGVPAGGAVVELLEQEKRSCPANVQHNTGQ